MHRTSICFVVIFFLCSYIAVALQHFIYIAMRIQCTMPLANSPNGYQSKGRLKHTSLVAQSNLNAAEESCGEDTENVTDTKAEIYS